VRVDKVVELGVLDPLVGAVQPDADLPGAGAGTEGIIPPLWSTAG
jgi:hypothetical protein